MKITITVLLFGFAVLALLLIFRPKPISIQILWPDMSQYILKSEHDRQIKKLNEMHNYQAEKNMRTILKLKTRLEK